MRPFLLLTFVALLTASVCVWAEINSQSDKQTSDLKCYLPYATTMDHMVMGCEISGYHMRYDLAQKGGVFFMILLPNGTRSIQEASTYFSIQTFPFSMRSLKELFDDDIADIIRRRPGTRVVKGLVHQLPLSTAGACVGAELAYPSELTAFTNESFYLCDTGSKKYSIMLSLSARSKEELDKAYPTFLKWMDVPQMVKDANIIIDEK